MQRLKTDGFSCTSVRVEPCNYFTVVYWNEHLTSFLSTKYWYLKTDLSVEHDRHNHHHI